MLMRRQGLDELGRSRHNGIEAYLGRLFGYACSLNHDRTAAQELVQECIVKALAARRVPGDEAAYRAWLFRILRNCYLDGLRRRSSRANGLEWAAADEGEIWSADRLIDVLAVKEGLRKLPGAMREIIVLIDIAGLNYAESAGVLGIPVGTVMSRLSRARANLQRIVYEQQTEETNLNRQVGSK